MKTDTNEHADTIEQLINVLKEAITISKTIKEMEDNVKEIKDLVTLALVKTLSLKKLVKIASITEILDENIHFLPSIEYENFLKNETLSNEERGVLVTKFLISRVAEEANIEHKEVIKIANKKIKSLDNLLTMTGALLILADEYGIKIDDSCWWNLTEK